MRGGVAKEEGVEREREVGVVKRGGVAKEAGIYVGKMGGANAWGRG